jgi:hypothetical protein
MGVFVRDIRRVAGSEEILPSVRSTPSLVGT